VIASAGTSLELTDTGNIASISGEIDLQAGTTATLNGVVESDSGAVSVTSTGQLQVGATGGVMTESGPIQLESQQNAVVLGASVTSTDGAIEVVAGTDITLAAGERIHSVNDDVTVTAGNDLFVNGEICSETGDVSLSATDNMTVSATGVIDTNSGNVELKTTDGDIELAGSVSTATGTSMINAGNDVNQADTSILSTGTMALEILAAGSIDLAGQTTSTNGPVDITAGDDLTIHSTAVVESDTSTVQLKATSGKADLAGTVTSNADAVSVDAGTDVLLAATASITAPSTVDVTAGGAITMTDGSVIESTLDAVTMSATNDITLGMVTAATQISLTTTNGAIVDGGDTGGVDLSAPELVLRAGTGIGSKNPLETNTLLIAATNSTSGNIKLANDPGNGETLVIGEVTDGQGTVTGISNQGTGDGGISVTNVGPIDVNSPLIDANEGGITLQALGTDSDLIINAPVQAELTGNSPVVLTTTGDLVINDTGEENDVQGSTVTGDAAGDVVFDETSGVKIRSSTGAVVAPTPLLENLLTPQITGEGVATVTFDFGHTGAENFYFIVLWDPRFIDRTGASPAVLDGQPIFGIFNSNSGATTTDFPSEFLQALNILQARAAAVGPVPANTIIDGYDQFALDKLGLEAFAGPGSFITTHTYLANPNKDVPYDPSADIPITVLMLDDGNITFRSGGQDLGQTQQTSEAGVPGDGLQGAVFYFDLSIDVPPLEAPRVVVSEAVGTSQTQVLDSQSSEETQMLVESETLSEDQIVIIEKIAPDGTLARLPNGDLMRKELRGSEAQQVLSDLPELLERLQEGHWRIYLQQGADAQPQLIRDLELRDGKPAGDDAGTQDRPPTSDVDSMPDDMPNDAGVDAMSLIPVDMRDLRTQDIQSAVRRIGNSATTNEEFSQHHETPVVDRATAEALDRGAIHDNRA
ncbi:MAG: hypothetical protein KDA58_06770, partial [Planctomycetaceae bacterium]|nr:hypothetical protein [Planctomycetaceae bacterium]